MLIQYLIKVNYNPRIKLSTKSIKSKDGDQKTCSSQQKRVLSHSYFSSSKGFPTLRKLSDFSPSKNIPRKTAIRKRQGFIAKRGRKVVVVVVVGEER